MSKVWFITGASRGLGLSMARAALAAGETVVATARDPGAVTRALGAGDDRLLACELDVAQATQAAAAVQAAVARFGRIDVLVNNAGYGHLGMFEESSVDEIERQFRVNVFGAMDVTRAVLPVMRGQRAGHVFTITSIGGLRGSPGASLYCATKFALEGWSEGLAGEVAPFGIRVTAVEPGRFRTDFLDASSARYPAASIADYAEAAAKSRAAFDENNHLQAGDPDKLADAMLQLVAAKEPPLHFLAGTDAVGVLETRIERDRRQLAAWGALSASTDLD